MFGESVECKHILFINISEKFGGIVMAIGLSQLTASNDLFVNERVRRKNAEEAYRKIEDYDNRKQEAILHLINEKLAEPEETTKEANSLGAGQVKQVHLPVGKTLEETIFLWRDVRTEALSQPEPTTADYQLAAKASSNIRRAESQLGLEKQAMTEVEAKVSEETSADFAQLQMTFPTPIEQTLFEREQKFKQAVSAYSFQVQMKMNGFKVDTPSFLKIA